MPSRAVTPRWLVPAAFLGVGCGVGCGAGCGPAPAAQAAAPEVVIAVVPPQPTAAPSAAASAETAPEEAEADGPGDVQEMGMVGLIGARGDDDPNAPTAPWGVDDSVGVAKGGLFGAATGDGFGGLGTVGVGTGGLLGGTRKSASSSVTMGAPSVSGRLPPAIIERIVRPNFGRFRLCYENGLQTHPTLEGRVAVKFVIGRDGLVSNVSNGGSDLPDAGVVSCVVRSFYGLSFPQPDSGIVIVVYPIRFAPGAAAPAAASAAPSATPSATAKAAPGPAPAPSTTP